MYREYFIDVEENINKVIDKCVNNIYIFEKSKLPYVRDILFLKNKYTKIIDNK